MILLKATIEAKRVGKYEGKEFVVLQCLERDERNALQLIEVNLPDGVDHSAFVQGKQVELAISVSYSKKNGKLYFRAIIPSPTTKAA